MDKSLTYQALKKLADRLQSLKRKNFSTRAVLLHQLDQDEGIPLPPVLNDSHLKRFNGVNGELADYLIPTRIAKFDTPNIPDVVSNFGACASNTIYLFRQDVGEVSQNYELLLQDFELIAFDLGQILRDMIGELQDQYSNLWESWKCPIFSANANEGRWLDFVFEVSWLKNGHAALASEKTVYWRSATIPLKDIFVVEESGFKSSIHILLGEVIQRNPELSLRVIKEIFDDLRHGLRLLEEIARDPKTDTQRGIQEAGSTSMSLDMILFAIGSDRAVLRRLLREFGGRQKTGLGYLVKEIKRNPNIDLGNLPEEFFLNPKIPKPVPAWFSELPDIVGASQYALDFLLKFVAASGDFKPPVQTIESSNLGTEKSRGDDALSETADQLKDNSLKLFTFLVSRKHKTYYSTLIDQCWEAPVRDESVKRAIERLATMLNDMNPNHFSVINEFETRRVSIEPLTSLAKSSIQTSDK